MTQVVRISIRTALVILGLPMICHFIPKAVTLHPDSSGGIKGQTKEPPVEELDYYFRKITQCQCGGRIGMGQDFLLEDKPRGHCSHSHRRAGPETNQGAGISRNRIFTR